MHCKKIVANKANSVDVDKWDYIARDCHHLGVQNNFDYIRHSKFVRVIETGGRKQICMRDKVTLSLQCKLHNNNNNYKETFF